LPAATNRISIYSFYKYIAATQRENGEIIFAYYNRKIGGDCSGEKFLPLLIGRFALGIVAKTPQRRRLLGHRERQSDRRKLLSATMSPAANDCGVVAESPTAKPERPNKNQ